MMILRPAAFGPACVKTQKRPHVVPSKLDWVSDEVGLHWKGVIGSKASQLRDTQHWITTSMSPVFKLCMVFSHSLGHKRPFRLAWESQLYPASLADRERSKGCAGRLQLKWSLF